MQADGALQGETTKPRRGRLKVLATLVIAAMVALAVWVIPLSTSEIGTGAPVPKADAGSAVIHDNAGNVHRNVGSAVLHDDAGSVHPD